MKKTIIGLSSLYLAVSSVSFPVIAAENNEDSDYSKEELVYSTIDLSGDLKEMYVTNLFELDNAKEIEDFGTYNELRLLNTEDSDLNYVKDEAHILTDENRVFTQGKVTDKQLPWTFDFSYSLNGKPVDPHKAAGKSGQVSVQVSISPTDESNEKLMDFYDHYALQISTSLDLDTHYNLKSENGIISTAGNKQQVQWTVLPGQDDPLSFTVETTELEELDWSINGAPLSLALGDDLFDISSFTNPLQELEDGITTLDGGAQALNNGSTDLTSGIQQLLDGSNRLSDGTSELSSKSQLLVEGTSKAYKQSGNLASGLGTLDAGSNQLAQSTNQLEAGSQELNKKSIQFFNGLDDLNNGISDLTGGLGEIEQGLNTLDGKSASLTENSALILKALQTMQAKVDNIEVAFNDVSELSEAADGIGSGLSALDNGIAGMDQTIDQYDSTLKETGLAPTDLAAQNKNYQESIQTLQNQIKTLQPLVEEGLIEQALVDDLTTTLNQTKQLLNVNVQYISGSDSLINGIHNQVEEDGALKSGSTQLINNYQAFHTAIDELVTGIASLSDELAPLQEGVDQLTENYSSLDQGVQDYTEGVHQLANGINKVTAASKQLDSGSTSLINGGEALENGINQLSDGATQLNQGADNLTQGIDDAHTGSLAFIEGISQLYNGTVALQSGAQDLFIGADDLSEGISEAEAGSTDLSNGANELAEGTSELQNETAGLPDKTKDKIDDAIEEFSNSDYEVQSYMDDRNDHVDNVQFVIQYRAQEEDTEDQTTDNSSEEHVSLWQKLLNLFT